MNYKIFDEIYKSNPEVYSKLVDYDEKGIKLKLNKELPQQGTQGSNIIQRTARHASEFK